MPSDARTPLILTRASGSSAVTVTSMLPSVASLVRMPNRSIEASYAG